MLSAGRRRASHLPIQHVPVAYGWPVPDAEIPHRDKRWQAHALQRDIPPRLMSLRPWYTVSRVVYSGWQSDTALSVWCFIFQLTVPRSSLRLCPHRDKMQPLQKRNSSLHSGRLQRSLHCARAMISVTGADTSKRFEQHDGDILSRSTIPSPNANANHEHGSWNQSALSGCGLSGDWPACVRG